MAFIWWPYCIIMLKPGIVWYKWGFSTTERKDFNSNADLTSDGWQSLTVNHGSISTSGWYAVVAPASNDSTPYLIKTFGSKVAAFEYSTEMYLQPSSWWGAQTFGVCWWDFPTWSWSPPDMVSFWNNLTSSWGYQAPSYIIRGTDSSYQWLPSSQQPNGNYVFRIKFNWAEYVSTVETTGGTILHTATYVSTRQPTQFWMEIRVGLTNENYCKCNWIELKY